MRRPGFPAQRQGRHHSADIVLVAGYYGGLTGHDRGTVNSSNSQQRHQPEEDEAAKFTSVIFATTEDTWGSF
jgi:predicted metalloprotease